MDAVPGASARSFIRLTTEQFRSRYTTAPAAGSADIYADRVRNGVRLLSADDKETLGSLYAAVADKYGPDSQQMKKVDRLARTLAAGPAPIGSPLGMPTRCHSRS